MDESTMLIRKGQTTVPDKFNPLHGDIQVLILLIA
jgi:hypothetical protein